MDPKEFLNTAEDLMASSKREADWRSAVSRAYYSVHLALRSAVESNLPLLLRQRWKFGKDPAGKEIDHKHLITHLIACGSTNKIGEGLSDLWLARIDCDYKVAKQISLDHAKEKLEDARDLWKAITALGGPEKIALTLKADLENK